MKNTKKAQSGSIQANNHNNLRLKKYVLTSKSKDKKCIFWNTKCNQEVQSNAIKFITFLGDLVQKIINNTKAKILRLTVKTLVVGLI